MGFASYFLIVWDFVRFAREAGIPASARGSGCGAIVSYLLYLSHVDPIKYDLLFERFLDPNRAEAPDIDIDLCQERRYEVIEYVRKKYGAANVAQIGTFGTMAAKAALKDVGRALNIPLAKVDGVAKLVPQVLHITLEDAIRKEPQLRRLAEEDTEVERLLDFARRLEGLARSAGHARGGRGDRRPAAAGPRPAPEAAEQGQGQGGRLHPVEHGRRREGRPAEDGLPRPAEPHEPRRGRPPDQRAAPRQADRPRQDPARRPDDLRPAPARRGQGPVPARGRGHPRPPGQDEARPLRRPDRHPRALPARAAQRRHGRRLREPQARAGEAGVSASRDEGSPGRDLRRDGLPGAGHADPEPARRDRPLRRVRDDQGDLEEEGRRHRAGAQAVRRGGRRAEARRQEGHRHLRPDRVLRRLRLQQVALDGVRPRPLPDGLAQGPLSDRVHGRRALFGDGRRRAREVLRRAYRGLQADGPGRPAARRQRRPRDVRRGGGGQDPVRPAGDQGRGPEGDRGDRGGAAGARADREPDRAVRARAGRRGQLGVRRGPDQGRRLRPARRAPRAVARRPAPRDQGRPGRGRVATTRAGRHVRHVRAGRADQRQRPRQRQRQAPPRPCPRSPSYPTPSGSPTRRRSSAST